MPVLYREDAEAYGVPSVRRRLDTIQFWCGGDAGDSKTDPARRAYPGSTDKFLR